jgi:conjugal transfer pilus assembly protein TraV
MMGRGYKPNFVLVDHEKRRSFPFGSLLGLASLGLLSGCTTLGGNVSGSFQCRAGTGVCAPAMLIDDQALAKIEGTARESQVAPAGPYYQPAGDPALISASAAGVAPTATREIRIVFPQYVDRWGRLHERTAVRALVAVSEYDRAAVARGISPAAASDLSMRSPARPTLEAVAGSAPLRGEVTGLAANASQPLTPVAAVAGAASAPDPIASIRQQVERQIADGPKAPPLARRSGVAAAKSDIGATTFSPGN